jgi:hypothetical protein
MMKQGEHERLMCSESETERRSWKLATKLLISVAVATVLHEFFPLRQRVE